MTSSWSLAASGRRLTRPPPPSVWAMLNDNPRTRPPFHGHTRPASLSSSFPLLVLYVLARPAPPSRPANDIDAPSMSLEQHRCSIDVVCPGPAGQTSATRAPPA